MTPSMHASGLVHEWLKRHPKMTPSEQDMLSELARKVITEAVTDEAIACIREVEDLGGDNAAFHADGLRRRRLQP